MTFSKKQGEKGAAMIVTIVMMVIVIGLTASYLSISVGYSDSTEKSGFKLKADEIASAGFKACVVRFISLSKNKQEPTSEKDPVTNQAPIPVATNNPWKDMPEFKTASGAWYCYPNWYQRSFAGGNFSVDVLVKKEAGKDTNIMFWSKGNYNKAIGEVLANYKINFITPQFDSKGPGTVSVQGDKKLLDPASKPFHVEFKGVPGLISGYDHNHDSKLTEKDDQTNGNYGLTTSLPLTFDIKTGGNATDQVIGALGQQKSDAIFMGDFLNQIIAHAATDADLKYDLTQTGDVKLSGSGTFGTESDYKVIYVKAGTSNKVTLTGNFEGYGIMVIDVDTPASTSTTPTTTTPSVSCLTCSDTKFVQEPCPVTETLLGICSKCNGTGLIACDKCNGTGKTSQECTVCGGDGQVPKDHGAGTKDCTTCNGVGTVYVTCAVCKGSLKMTCTTCNGIPPAGTTQTCSKCLGTGWRTVACTKCPTPAPTSTSTASSPGTEYFDTSGNPVWHGTIIVRVNGDATSLGSRYMAFSTGNPSIVGTMILYFPGAIKVVEGNKFVEVRGTPAMKWSSEAWANSLVRLSSVLGKREYILTSSWIRR